MSDDHDRLIDALRRIEHALWYVAAAAYLGLCINACSISDAINRVSR